jgi:hypothetical protein
MVCPYLEYRDGSDEPDRDSFDEARAYCTAADRFVQPMRADICNDRYDLVHDRDCEIYREHADDAAAAGDGDGETNADGAGDGE